MNQHANQYPNPQGGHPAAGPQLSQPTNHQIPSNPVAPNQASTGQQGPNPPNPFAAPVQGSGSAATGGQVQKGRGRFIAGMAALAIAAGAGLGGYVLAGGNGDGEPDTVAAADESSADDGTGDDSGTDGASGASESSDTDDPNDPDTMTIDESMNGSTPVPGAAMTVEQANASVIRIEATGEFADPQFGLIEGVGSGSGFIISPDGIAVTNNHVVAGAAFLEVYIPGEDRPRNARILGTSECSDLAVIDIEGDGFPQVALNMTDPAIGAAVYAAGYPLGDPEFTLTKGIVSRAQTPGDTRFSSVDGVLEHDARINPGNSGGPLFDEFGQVVGINYQGDPSTRQSFAITPGNARSIIDQLTAGNSVDSIGINGQVVDLGGTFGIFVSSVETGSMADEVGVVAGDVILELENVAVSTDGTMGAYCDVLRTNGTDVPLEIAVYRPATEQVLFGTLNDADDSLVVGFDSGEMMSNAGMTADNDTAGDEDASPASTGEFMELSDDWGAVSVEVPTSWADVAGSPLGDSEDIPNLTAADDLDGFVNGWTTGGIQLTAFDKDRFDFDQIWDARSTITEDCETVENAESTDLGRYSGITMVAHGCGTDGLASLILFQVDAPDTTNFASGIIQVLTAEDVAAAERALVTFTVI